MLMPTMLKYLRFFLPFPSRTNFDTISGVLRLSKKYEVDSLHKRALVHLASAFPLISADYPGSPSWDTIGLDIPIILFARELALEWVLPVAFYRLCSKATINQIENGVCIDNQQLGMDPKDKLTCLEQYVLLRGSASADILNFLWDPLKICLGNQCQNERIARRKVAEGWRAQGILPLGLWEPSDWDGTKVCATCLAAMKTAHGAALEEFWDGLPQRFGLPPWGDLIQMKESALGN